MWYGDKFGWLITVRCTVRDTVFGAFQTNGSEVGPSVRLLNPIVQRKHLELGIFHNITPYTQKTNTYNSEERIYLSSSITDSQRENVLQFSDSDNSVPSSRIDCSCTSTHDAWIGPRQIGNRASPRDESRCKRPAPPRGQPDGCYQTAGDCPTNPFLSMTAPYHKPGCRIPAKATLFCPRCGHASRHDGDWQVVETTRETRLLCPDCETEIAAREADSRQNRRQCATVFWQPWTNSVGVWLEVWARAMRPTEL